MAETMAVLAWELREGLKYDEAIIRKQILTNPQPLSIAELGERRRQFNRLRVRTLLIRPFAYFMSCAFCQNCWTAISCVAIFADWHRGGIIRALLPSGLAYGAMVVVFSKLLSAGSPPWRAKEGACGSRTAAPGPTRKPRK